MPKTSKRVIQNVYYLFFKPFWNDQLDMKIIDSDSCCINSGYGQSFPYTVSSELIIRDSSFKSDALHILLNPILGLQSKTCKSISPHSDH